MKYTSARVSNNWLEDCTLVVNAYQALRKRPARGDPIVAAETYGGVTVGQFGLSVDVYTLGPFIDVGHAYFLSILANTAPSCALAMGAAGGVYCIGLCVLFPVHSYD